ncbi:hypothetical protein K4K57_000568 [Colletotrichum sp. SAR 10_99]|nr:hypothetical protein K4K57_000568 [Colletotrichum sp. SAR 10_99]
MQPSSFIEPLFASWNASGVAADFLNNFQSPPTLFRPYVRWWWPHGAVENDEIQAEVIQMAEAGFGGVEIEDVHHSTNAVKVALTEANSRGMGHDFAFGPAWPMAVPTIVPDDQAAAKEIVLGKAIINATTTYNGSVPGPFSKRRDGVNEQELVAVQAWRISQDSDPYGNPVYLDSGSMVDLTDAVTDGKVAFSPPDNSSWLLFSAIIRGTGQQPEDYPHTTPASYVVDHFSEAGAQAVIDFWEDQILTAEMLELIAQTPTSLFEDSQEMVAATYWTPNFVDEFLSRRGYSVMDILPVVTQYKNNAYLFLFNDSGAQRGSLHDYHETITDLYADYHIAPLRKWLNSRGMKYRAQPYGIDKLDSMRIATTLDIPEGESLGFQVIDDYRVLAGANSFAGVNIMSNELGAYNKAAYATTWAKILGTVNPQFAAGLTHNVLHGFSYIYGPETTWPGWGAFTPYKGRIGYSESWGPRTPTWMHASDFTAYMGRVSYFASQGIPKYDCAFFRQNGASDDHYVGPYFTSEGAQIGWTTTLNLTTLTPWSDIDGLQNVSGNATYSTEFVLGTADAPYVSDTGAYMELDMFQGSFRAKVNGETLGSLDQMAHRFDVSKWLRNGTNTLEMEVATSLINRMRAFQPQYYEQYARQKYGLKSVTIRPFSQVAL